MKFIKKQFTTIKNNDPCLKNIWEIFLYPGFKAQIYYKISHWFYIHKHFFLARLLSERCKRKTAIEIHPGATIGNNLFIDHGNGIVIGETAIIGDNVVIYHDVTLGGITTNKGKRHPTIKDNVMIGSGARILGNITVGNNCKIGANAIVLKDVPDDCTAVGIPARIIKH